MIQNLIIDIGHSPTKPGASGLGYKEHILAEEIALSLWRKAKAIGIKVDTLTRSNDLGDRVYQANLLTPNSFLVSIHLNAFSDPNANGVETWISHTAFQRSIDTANRTQEKLVELGYANRGVKKENFKILCSQHSSMLVECGFITNYRDMELYNPDKLASAILEGITGLRATADNNTKLLLDCIGSQYVHTGSKGSLVYLVQATLVTRGYTLSIDGLFGGETFRAIQKFQQDNNLVVDGSCGRKTFEKLLK